VLYGLVFSVLWVSRESGTAPGTLQVQLLTKRRVANLLEGTVFGLKTARRQPVTINAVNFDSVRACKGNTVSIGPERRLRFD